MDSLGYSRYAFMPREVSENGSCYRVFINIVLSMRPAVMLFFYRRKDLGHVDLSNTLDIFVKSTEKISRGL